MDEEMFAGSKRSRSPGHSESTLEFITFTNPEMAKTATSRQRVRSQAMRNFHRRSDPPKRRRNEIELDISSLLQRSRQVHDREILGTESSGTPQALRANDRTYLSPVTLLGASRFDPFFQYPIQMGYRERELYGHLYDESCVMFQTMRDIGFLNRVRHTASFCQILAMSSWHLHHRSPESQQQSDHLAYSLMATRELQSQIMDSRESVTDDAILAVLAFACSANLLHDSHSLNVHMNGLELMINQRGGLHTLDSNPLLRIMLYWADINGASVQDISPRFPPPEHLLPRSRIENQNLSSQTSSSSSPDERIIRFSSDLRHVQDLIKIESSQRHLWSDPVFAGFHISPILHDLLSLRVEIGETDVATFSLEAFRLAAILYICNLRSRFGIDSLSYAPLYGGKLLALLSSEMFRTRAEANLLVWILAVGVTSPCSIGQKAQFAEYLRGVSEAGDISIYEDLLNTLRQMVWSDEILLTQTQILKEFMKA